MAGNFTVEGTHSYVAAIQHAGLSCETRKCGMVRNAGAEIEELESAALDCKGGKCRTGICGTNLQGWKMRDNRVWKACLRIRDSVQSLCCYTVPSSEF